MHIVVVTQGTDREPEDCGCKRDRVLIENRKTVVVRGTVA